VSATQMDWQVRCMEELPKGHVEITLKGVPRVVLGFRYGKYKEVSGHAYFAEKSSFLHPYIQFYSGKSITGRSGKSITGVSTAGQNSDKQSSTASGSPQTFGQNYYFDRAPGQNSDEESEKHLSSEMYLSSELSSEGISSAGISEAFQKQTFPSEERPDFKHYLLEDISLDFDSHQHRPFVKRAFTLIAQLLTERGFFDGFFDQPEFASNESNKTVCTESGANCMFHTGEDILQREQY
jgi:hypothetical protein